jgi:hypothetical protein
LGIHFACELVVDVLTEIPRRNRGRWGLNASL